MSEKKQRITVTFSTRTLDESREIVDAIRKIGNTVHVNQHLESGWKTIVVFYPRQEMGDWGTRVDFQVEEIEE